MRRRERLRYRVHSRLSFLPYAEKKDEKKDRLAVPLAPLACQNDYQRRDQDVVLADVPEKS